MTRANLTKYAWLSIVAAVLTIGLKAAAYFLTGSVGLLSDALESVINLAAAIIALLILKTAVAPPDDEHAYGHDKAEYFSGAIEGTLILIAAAAIGWAAINKLFAPQPLEQVGVGLLITAIAAVINLIVGQILIRKGKEHQSITLEADGKHLMTDVWTSAAVGVGVFAVWLTNWATLDPIIALLAAVNIAWTGFYLLRRSAHGLMDVAISDENRAEIVAILDGYVRDEGIDYHAFRTRQSGIRKFVAVHIIVPGEWTVHAGHQLLEKIEADIHRAVSNTVVFTHLESLDDPASWNDIELDHLSNFDTLGR